MALASDLFPKPNTTTNKAKIIVIVLSAAVVVAGFVMVVPKVSAFIQEMKKSNAQQAQDQKSAPTDTPMQAKSQSETQLQQWKNKPNVINQNQLANSNSDIGNQDLAFVMSSDDLKKEQAANAKAQASAIDPPQVNETLKAERLKEDAEDEEDYLGAKKKIAKSPYEIQAGSVIPATLNTLINSDLPGFVTGIVRQNVYDTVSGSFLLIPKGTKLFGKYESSIGYGQNRILIQWNRLIFSDGSSLSLRKMNGDKGALGTDREGASGFNDTVDNHISSLFSGAILMSVIGAGAQLSQPQTSSSNNGLSQNQTIGQVMAGQVGQQIAGTAGKIIDKNLNIPPTIMIRAGYEFNIMVNKDIILDPVNDDY